MLAMDVRLALLSFVLLPGTVWINRRVGAMRRRITTERQRRLALMTSQVQESLSVSGVLLGRSMGRSPELTERFAGDAGGLADLEVRSQMAGKWQQSTISITFAAVPAVTYWLGGLALTGGPTVSIGTLVAFTTLQSSLFNPLNALLRTGVQVQSSLALFARIFEYLDLPVDIVESPSPVALPAVRGDVRLSDVSFAYEPGAPTLTDVSLDVPAGSTLAVVGATGSARPRSATCSPACTTWTPARSPSTASTSATCPWPRWLRRSASSRRIRTCCTPRSPRTFVSPGPMPPTTSSWRLPVPPGSTT